MAREDFCFTWYDGDAASDMQHMDRLCRGAYYDLVSFQRKVGAFTIEQAKKVLSKDFEQCWPAIELILKQDEQGKYFIEWVVTSLEKTRVNSKKNKERIDEYWRKVDAGEIIHKPKHKKNQTNTEDIPRNNHGIQSEEPYGNGIGVGNGIENKEGGTGEGTQPGTLVHEMTKIFIASNEDYPLEEHDPPIIRELAIKIFKWLKIPGQYTDLRNKNEILLRWGEVVNHIKSNDLYCKWSLLLIQKHFQSITQSFSNGGKDNKGRTGPDKPADGKGPRRGL